MTEKQRGENMTTYLNRNNL